MMLLAPTPEGGTQEKSEGFGMRQTGVEWHDASTRDSATPAGSETVMTLQMSFSGTKGWMANADFLQEAGWSWGGG